MHTTKSYAVFPFSAFSREHWFILWTTFSIKAAKTKPTKDRVERIRSTLASEVWMFHKKWEPEPEEKGHPKKQSAAVRTPRNQGNVGRRMSSFNSKWPFQVLLSHRCQMRQRHLEHTEHCWYKESAGEFTVASLPQIFTPYRAKPSLLVPLSCCPNLWKSLCYAKNPQIALLLPWLKIWLTGEQQL